MSTQAAENRKCFGQLCTVARALDIIGDRWTLLILRELLGGSARFIELQAGLPGIAKNLLTDRLRRLEGDGLVRRVGTARSTLYALTDLGEEVRPVVEALGIWGAKAPALAAPEHDRSLRSIAVALHTFLTRSGDALPEERCIVELSIDGQPLEIVIGPTPSVTARPSARPDARVETSRAAMSGYLSGRAFDRKAFALAAGDKVARSALLRAMGRVF